MTAAAEKLLPNTPEWLEARRKGLGASDAPTALGFSKWGTPQDVCLSKWGEDEERDETEAMHRGHVLEPVLLALYNRIHNRKAVPACMMFHESLDFMFATPDGLLDDEPEPGLVQIKTCDEWASADWGEEGTEDIPTPYLIQVAHEMAVTNRDWVDVAVLFASGKLFKCLVDIIEGETMPQEKLLDMIEGNLDFRVYHIERDPEFEQNLIAAEIDFWESYVVPHVMPANLNLADPGTKECRDATEEESRQIAIMKKHWMAEQRAKVRVAGKREVLEAYIGTDYGIRCPNTGDKITWGKNKDCETVEVDCAFIVTSLAAKFPDHAEEIAKLVADNTKTVTKPGSRAFRMPTKKWGADL